MGGKRKAYDDTSSGDEEDGERLERARKRLKSKLDDKTTNSAVYKRAIAPTTKAARESKWNASIE